jgi:hypothetical protein
MGVENTHKKDMGVTKEVGLDFFFVRRQGGWLRLGRKRENYMPIHIHMYV